MGVSERSHLEIPGGEFKKKEPNYKIPQGASSNARHNTFPVTYGSHCRFVSCLPGTSVTHGVSICMITKGTDCAGAMRGMGLGSFSVLLWIIE